MSLNDKIPSPSSIHSHYDDEQPLGRYEYFQIPANSVAVEKKPATPGDVMLRVSSFHFLPRTVTYCTHSKKGKELCRKLRQTVVIGYQRSRVINTGQRQVKSKRERFSLLSSLRRVGIYYNHQTLLLGLKTHKKYISSLRKKQYL
ncbi:hypothetical protein D791_01858 [Nitrincola nitratireducens]|uniref:Uncharacterized protein n=1 Tax=Nitrincola nitratireducens TaxID=1229521 RepID=W9VLJ2_9GAMM|nr:hypothetical protein D791_01858 [Nitrincola nitratireducens]